MNLARQKNTISTDLSTLQQSLGVSFNHPSFLEQALTHSSYSNENPEFAPASNERLEFLGDAILGLIVAEKLYHDFPQLSEGEMTRLRSVLVCQDALARVARTIKLGDYLYLGKGERASGGQRKPANLASAFEAVIAAIYLDQGLPATRAIILRLIDAELQKVVNRGIEIDYKSRLQEFIQSRQPLLPVYRVIDTTGPDHEKTFVVEVSIGDTVLGRGAGKSKKTAEIEAARMALQQLAVNFTQ